MKILNVENGLEMLGGDKELYAELIEEFLKHPFDDEEVLRLIKEENLQDAASKVHRLKGSCANIGGEALQNASSTLEKVLRGKEAGDVNALLQAVKIEYQKLLQEAKNALTKLL